MTVRDLKVFLNACDDDAEVRIVDQFNSEDENFYHNAVEMATSEEDETGPYVLLASDESVNC